MADKTVERKRLRGFYESNGSWRWTSRVFAVSLDPPAPAKPAYLALDCYLPGEMMSKVRTATLTARVNGAEVGRQTYSAEGRYLFSRLIPARMLPGGAVDVEFELDKSVRDPGNKRVLGLIAVSVWLSDHDKTPEGKQRILQSVREAYAQVRERRNLPISPAQDRDLMELFHESPVWSNVWFHNVKVLKSPLDMWVLQDIIREVRPDFVIETGTFRGGSALAFANMLNGMGLTNSRVLTVDIQDFRDEASAHPLWKEYVEFYLGSSTDPEIVSRISRKARGRKTLIDLDSDHSMSHVLKELRMYSPLVSRGSYIVVDDTHLDGVPTYPGDIGPMAAVVQFLKEGGSQEFEQDVTRERMGMTGNPGGWLRRK